jgi:hypothetical protein
VRFQCRSIGANGLSERENRNQFNTIPMLKKISKQCAQMPGITDVRKISSLSVPKKGTSLSLKHYSTGYKRLKPLPWKRLKIIDINIRI